MLFYIILTFLNAQMMILVTGATGHLGSATIDFLLKKIPANEIAALVRDASKGKTLAEKGIDVRIGNYHDYDSLVKAFKGIDKLLLISSNDFNDRTGQQLNAINAAKEAGVKHVIYTSAVIKDIKTTAIPFVMDTHHATAEYLKASGLIYTLMNNNLYADVLPMFLGAKVLETGVYIPTGEGTVPFATRLDMAEANANVLTTSGHENKEYNISSTTLYSFADIATLLSELSGKQIVYIDPTKEDFIAQLKQVGVPEEYIGVTAGFAEAIKGNEFNLPDDSLEKILGRKPVELKEYLRQTYFSGVN